MWGGPQSGPPHINFQPFSSAGVDLRYTLATRSLPCQFIDDRHADYITRQFARPDAVLEQVLAAIPKRGLPAITIKPEEGRFLQFLVRANGARRVVEIGTLGGYSGIWLARGLPADGRLITLEKSRSTRRWRASILRWPGWRQGEFAAGRCQRIAAVPGSRGPFDFLLYRRR